MTTPIALIACLDDKFYNNGLTTTMEKLMNIFDKSCGSNTLTNLERRAKIFEKEDELNKR